VQRTPGDQVLRKLDNHGRNGGGKMRKRQTKKTNKVKPVTLVPTTLEEAPLRRMDRRALNALRRRRADRHMIACLVLTAIILVMLGVGSIVIWDMYR
jgi:hypothetical protein